MKARLIRMAKLAASLFFYGLGYVVACKLTGDPPTLSGFAVVIGMICLYDLRKLRDTFELELLERKVVVNNVVPMPTKGS